MKKGLFGASRGMVVVVLGATPFVLALWGFGGAPLPPPPSPSSDPQLTAMLEASRAGDLARLKQLIEEGGNVREKTPFRFDPGPRSCLEAAAYGGHAETVQFLLDRDRELEGRSYRKTVEFALTGLIVAPKDEETAARYRATIDLLIPRDPPVFTWDDPAMLSVIAGLPNETLRLVQGRCDHLTACLYQRARGGCATEIMGMLEHCFGVEDMVVPKHPRGIAELNEIPRGATYDQLVNWEWIDRRTLPRVDGVAFLDIMLTWESDRKIKPDATEGTSQDECGQILPHLLEVGANPNTFDGRQTPLHRAVLAGNAQGIAALLEYGADPNAADFEGKTPRELDTSPEIQALFDRTRERAEP